MSPGSVSIAGMSDIAEFMKVIDRAQALMRTYAFRQLFPEDHVRRWGSGYRAVLLLVELRKLRLLSGVRWRSQALSLTPWILWNAPRMALEVAREVYRRRRYLRSSR
jgi:hypothetical protein